jgi:hypothetical protein
MVDDQPLRIDGRLNLLWLLGVIATVFLVGMAGDHLGGATGKSIAQIAAMALFAGLSVKTTPARSTKRTASAGPHPGGRRRVRGCLRHHDPRPLLPG